MQSTSATTAKKEKKTRKVNVKKLAVAAVLAAVAVVGSYIYFPVFGSKCSPVQHIVNVFCAVLLGPAYGVGAALIASILRNIMGLGTLLAFPGSMIGALLGGLLYRVTKKPWLALVLAIVGEVFGTGVLGGLCAYPVALLFMNADAASTAFYAYIVPFLISTVVGSLMSGAVVAAMQRTKVLDIVKKSLD